MNTQPNQNENPKDNPNLIITQPNPTKPNKTKLTILFVALYGILATICAIYFYWNLQNERNYQDVYAKLALGKPVNVLAIGDSISEGSGASDREHKWVNLVKQYLIEHYDSEIYLENHSRPGCSSISGITTTLELPDDRVYDLILLCYGQNDSLENFEVYYEGLVRQLREKNPGCEILCIQESAQKGYTEKMQIIAKIAAHYGYPVVDTIAPFLEGTSGAEDDYGRYDTLTDDDVHPNDAGHQIYAECIEQIIKSKVANRARANATAYNEGANFFNGAKWYTLEQMERDGQTYTLKLKENIVGTKETNPFNDGSGVMMIMEVDDYPGYNGVTIQNNGTEIARREQEWPYEFAQGHTVVLNNNCILEAGELRITFDTPEQADSFWGIGFLGEGD